MCCCWQIKTRTIKCLSLPSFSCIKERETRGEPYRNRHHVPETWYKLCDTFKCTPRTTGLLCCLCAHLSYRILSVFQVCFWNFSPYYTLFFNLYYSSIILRIIILSKGMTEKAIYVLMRNFLSLKH